MNITWKSGSATTQLSSKALLALLKIINETYTLSGLATVPYCYLDLLNDLTATGNIATSPSEGFQGLVLVPGEILLDLPFQDNAVATVFHNLTGLLLNNYYPERFSTREAGEMTFLPEGLLNNTAITSFLELFKDSNGHDAFPSLTSLNLSGATGLVGNFDLSAKSGLTEINLTGTKPTGINLTNINADLVLPTLNLVYETLTLVTTGPLGTLSAGTIDVGKLFSKLLDSTTLNNINIPLGVINVDTISKVWKEYINEVGHDLTTNLMEVTNSDSQANVVIHYTNEETPSLETLGFTFEEENLTFDEGDAVLSSAIETTVLASDPYSICARISSWTLSPWGTITPSEKVKDGKTYKTSIVNLSGDSRIGKALNNTTENVVLTITATSNNNEEVQANRTITIARRGIDTITLSETEFLDSFPQYGNTIIVTTNLGNSTKDNSFITYTINDSSIANITPTGTGAEFYIKKSPGLFAKLIMTATANYDSSKTASIVRYVNDYAFIYREDPGDGKATDAEINPEVIDYFKTHTLSGVYTTTDSVIETNVISRGIALEVTVIDFDNEQE